jgi:hypothetical protein
MPAPPFPPAWGYDSLVKDQGVNILNSSIEVWRNVGKPLNSSGLPSWEGPGMGYIFLFGMLPILIGMIIFMRTQKAWLAAMAFLLSGSLEIWFGLDISVTAKYIYIGLVFAVALIGYTAMRNK